MQERVKPTKDIQLNEVTDHRQRADLGGKMELANNLILVDVKETITTTDLDAQSNQKILKSCLLRIQSP